MSGPTDTSASLNQDVYGLIVGRIYVVTYSAWFDACNNVLLRVFIYNEPVDTFDGCNYGQNAVGQYADVFFSFTATANPANLRFEFVVSAPTAIVKLDNVALYPY